jgi:hypothetical protein
MTRACLVIALLGGMAPWAEAATHRYVIAIGNNAAPARSPDLPPLRYADDDAAAFYTFARGSAEHAALLSVLDATSQRRFPGLAAESHAPTLTELRQTVARFRGYLEADRRAGHESVLLLFYSGHGDSPDQGPASLTLLDGDLTREVLYREVIDQLPASFVHLIVDACHAEAVVRPRDAQAELTKVTGADLAALAGASTLARYPNVGAIIASAAAAQAHEWDAFERGVFTHEVLSGLRGAADVNGDGRIEYSELSAFLAAANRSVADPRARLNVVVKPPAQNGRAPLVDLGTARTNGRVTGSAAGLGAIHFEDELGNRLADLRAEPGFRVNVSLPAGPKLFVCTAAAEGELVLAPGQAVDLSTLALHPPRQTARGALDDSLHRGLFATPYGPLYYRGYVDGRTDFVPLSEPAAPAQREPVPPPSRVPERVAFVTAGALAATALTFTVLSLRAQNDFDSTRLERPAADAHDRFTTDRAVAIGAGIGAAVATGIGVWLHIRMPSVAVAASERSAALHLSVDF